MGACQPFCCGVQATMSRPAAKSVETPKRARLRPRHPSTIATYPSEPQPVPEPATLTLFVRYPHLAQREPEDVTTAGRLVENLWTQPKLRPELTDVLELDAADVRATRASREALLMFRVRPRGRYHGR